MDADLRTSLKYHDHMLAADKLSGARSLEDERADAQDAISLAEDGLRMMQPMLDAHSELGPSAERLPARA